MTERTHAQRVDELANEFIETIQRWLGSHGCGLVDELNRAEINSVICHTHDFCDANMAMEEAYRNVWGDHLAEDEGIDFAHEDVAAEVGDAWMLAKTRGFTVAPTAPEILTLRALEGELRDISTGLWQQTMDDPETATVESEEAGMTPERRAIRDLMNRISLLADKVETLINNQPLGGVK